MKTTILPTLPTGERCTTDCCGRSEIAALPRRRHVYGLSRCGNRPKPTPGRSGGALVVPWYRRPRCARSAPDCHATPATARCTMAGVPIPCSAANAGGGRAGTRLQKPRSAARQPLTGQVIPALRAGASFKCSRSRAWCTWWAPCRVHWPPVRVRCPCDVSRAALAPTTGR